MATCVHHWRQEVGDLRAPFVCIHCGESRVMETDFYRLFEDREGRELDKIERTADRPAVLA